MVAWGFSDFKEGGRANPPEQANRTDAPRVLVFVHPKCPCTRSTLEQILPTLDKYPVTAEFVFLQPPDAIHLQMLDAKLKNGQVRIVHDKDGDIARQYAAKTSGQCIVYDAEGHLRFSGGITAGRGHVGPCEGLQAFEAALRRPVSSSVDFPVFGCPLL